MSNIITRFRNNKYFNERRKILLFGILLLLVLFLASYLFKIAYARYETSTKINANIQKALYIFGADEQSFNLEPDGIIPKSSPYVYKFSVSNFNDEHETDVDISYDLSIRTTTNLPITIKLYRNELYDSSGATNLFSGSTSLQDSDGAWYRLYKCPDSYEMYYKNKTTDIYTIVVNFPQEYAKDLTYENDIENIEVNIKSRQM